MKQTNTKNDKQTWRQSVYRFHRLEIHIEAKHFAFQPGREWGEEIKWEKRNLSVEKKKTGNIIQSRLNGNTFWTVEY